MRISIVPISWGCYEDWANLISVKIWNSAWHTVGAKYLLNEHLIPGYELETGKTAMLHVLIVHNPNKIF